MQVLAAAIAGIVFGLGILVAGMADPAKVLNFFDLAGTWDPSLAFVMGGALAVTATGYAMAFRRARPVLAPTFNLPGTRRIDLPLVAGATLFGIGWGLAGFCPGGVVPALGIGRVEPLIFFAGLAIGLTATRLARSRLHARAA
jgi:uncharacterized membrane protein YedE/YeeE